MGAVDMNKYMFALIVFFGALIIMLFEVAWAGEPLSFRQEKKAAVKILSGQWQCLY